MSKPEFQLGDIVKIIDFNYTYINKEELKNLQLKGFYHDSPKADELHDNSIIAQPINKEELGKLGVIENCIISQGIYKYGLRFEDNSYKAWYNENILKFVSRKTINYGHREM